MNTGCRWRVAGFGLVICLLTLAPATLLAAPKTTDSPNQLQVVRVHFQGVHQLSTAELKKILKTKQKGFRLFTKAPLDEEVLNDDLKRIEEYYRSEGFYHMQLVSHAVVPVTGNQVRVDIVIEEGPPMLVNRVDVLVNEQSASSWHSELSSALPLQPGKRFTSTAYKECETVALRYFADRAYPKAKVDLRARLNKENNQAEIVLEVTTGPVCTFGPISLEGNRKVEDQVVLRELTFHRGEPFNASKIQESQQRLFNLLLFQFVDFTVEGMDSDSTELPIHILVKEAKKQTVRAGVGYGTEDKYRGRLEWEIRNFLGDGRRLQFNARASDLTQIFEGVFQQPYFLGPENSLVSRVGVSHNNLPAYENRDFFFTNMVERRLTPYLAAQFGYNLEANRLLNVDLDLVARERADQDNEEFYISSLLAGLPLIKVDDLLNPKSGFQILPNIEWASGILGSQVDFVKLTLEGRGYVPAGSYGVFAARLLGGTIYNLENTQSIPIFKRFFCGGANSVRGYPYQKLGPLDVNGNPIGGYSLLEGNLEYRFPLPWPESMEGVVFFDFGNVFENHFDQVSKGLRYTSGGGLRYLTPVGPVRFDFGYELNPPKGDFFNPYQFYFSIGQAF